VRGGAGIAGNVYANRVYSTEGLYWAGNGNVMSTGGGGGGGFTTSNTAPPGPALGDEWYSPATDVLYKYINDGTSSLWLDLTSPLYNANTAKIPGVNPLKFNSLEEYVEFTEWQRSQGIICPILYLQEVYDTQGNPVYKARPSPTDLQGGLPDLMPDDVNPQESKLIDATRDTPPFNQNSYPAFDPHNLYIGLDTPLDKIFHEKTKISSNPMDANWGGNKYTSSLINAGYYGKDTV
jgi:hypothetical protein